MEPQRGASIFPYERWTAELEELTERFREAQPFPHIVVDDFLDAEAAQRCLDAFPVLDSSGWINYTHVNERKFGKSKRSELPDAIGEVIDELNSPAFVELLEHLTGIDDLIADPSLMGGGIHQSPAGGYLNVHADFTGHPHQSTWQRRINVLVYLNRHWPDEYGGHLELWDTEMKALVQKVKPVFNRAVIFRTNADSFHGHPLPLTCPSGETRKSIALYYFTEEHQPFQVRSTEYRARPGDGLKAVPIFLDKWVLRVYDAVKRKLRLEDDFASKVLQMASFRRQGKRNGDSAK